MTQIVTIQTSWLKAMTDRYEEIKNRVADERASLPAFRRDEATDLALTPDEQKEMRELERMLFRLGQL